MALYTITTHANLLPGVWVEKVFIPELRARLQIQPLARESTLTDNQGLVTHLLEMHVSGDYRFTRNK